MQSCGEVEDPLKIQFHRHRKLYNEMISEASSTDVKYPVVSPLVERVSD